MILWVRLIVSSIENVHSVYELRRVVESLPKGLEEMYVLLKEPPSPRDPVISS